MRIKRLLCILEYDEDFPAFESERRRLLAGKRVSIDNSVELVPLERKRGEHVAMAREFLKRHPGVTGVTVIPVNEKWEVEPDLDQEE